MKCKWCGSKLSKVKTDGHVKQAVNNLGVPFSGSYRCLVCYP